MQITRPFQPPRTRGVFDFDVYWQCAKCDFSTYSFEEAIEHARSWLNHTMESRSPEAGDEAA